jgi:3-mercaptopyruvate sulfurtransferase SseA
MNMNISGRILSVSLAVLGLLIASFACNALLPQAESTQAPLATVIVEPTFDSESGPPQTEADVPRVSVQEAKAAFESGAAAIMDVRSAESFAISHIKGALSIPLANIEQNPAEAFKDKKQWIITYCT